MIFPSLGYNPRKLPRGGSLDWVVGFSKGSFGGKASIPWIRYPWLLAGWFEQHIFSSRKWSLELGRGLAVLCHQGPGFLLSFCSTRYLMAYYGWCSSSHHILVPSSRKKRIEGKGKMHISLNESMTLKELFWKLNLTACPHLTGQLCFWGRLPTVC